MNAIVKTETGKVSLLAKMAQRYSVEPEKMLTTLKATAFRGDVTNEQLMALLIVADQYDLNPWLKQIYAFPDRNGIVPVVGVDGWARIINEHPQFDGMDFEQDDDKCTCRIHRKDRHHAVEVTEYMAECHRDTSPWKSHPRRMLRHKAIIQCARLAFGFTGIFDEDEAERIVEAQPATVGKPVVSMPEPKTKPEPVTVEAAPQPLSAEQQEFVADLGKATARAPQREPGGDDE